MDYVKALFSAKGLVIVIYVLVGVFVNTSPPHLPTAAFRRGWQGFAGTRVMRPEQDVRRLSRHNGPPTTVLAAGAVNGGCDARGRRSPPRFMVRSLVPGRSVTMAEGRPVQ
jgi:hypothetical protein